MSKLKASFLTANDTDDVNSIIKGILTPDEQIKVGRRIQIAELYFEGKTYFDISKRLSVGQTTVLNVVKQITKNENCYRAILNKDLEIKYKIKKAKNKKVGSSKLVFKRRLNQSKVVVKR